jgi:hypothetical protein
MKTLKVLKYVGFGILGFVFIVAVIFGVQALWNWLIPELFNGPALTFWQTVGLFLLSKILLTGIAPGPQHDHKKDWKKKYRDRCRLEAKEDQNLTTAEQV